MVKCGKEVKCGGEVRNWRDGSGNHLKIASADLPISHLTGTGGCAGVSLAVGEQRSPRWMGKSGGGAVEGDCELTGTFSS